MRLDNGAAPRDNWYRLGYCPQCQAQVMVRNTSGIFDSYRKNFMQADLVFADGHHLRTVICENCFKNPNFQGLIDSILHEKSEGFKTSNQNFEQMSRNYITRTYETHGAPIELTETTPKFTKRHMTSLLGKDKFQTMENPNQVFQGGQNGN